MRLHHLTATAFGPFVDTVSVDFDALSAGGLFLLTGDTGAGKTSVLDAVCFALYGEVPGDRHTAHHLHSDQADPFAAPEVTLRLSVGARTFRFTRSPAWTRPKKRGTGNVRIQAHVLVEEATAHGDWRTLTHRLDEAGHLVTGLLGMTCTQFTQVAMLPQNKFQEFLRASSAERQAVLQRLFRTRRFEDVERWLAERRLALHRESQGCHERVSGAVNRLIEAAGPAAGWPEAWDVHDLEPVVAELGPWASEVHARASVEAASTEQRAAAADGAHDAARGALDEARETSRLRVRARQARDVLDALDGSADRHQELARRLEAHGRATPVIPLVRRASATADARAAADERAEERIREVAALLEVDPAQVDSAELGAAATRTAAARAVAETWLPREDTLRRDRVTAAELGHQVAELTEAAARLARGLDTAEARRQELGAALEAARTAARSLPADEAHELAATTARDAARIAETLRQQQAEQRERLVAATLEAQELRSRYLDLREARIAGMAAELAEGLAVGCSCPVCGSAEHPAPATAQARVTRTDEDDARAAYESADFERQAIQELLTTTTTQLEAAEARSEGRPSAYWEEQWTGAVATLKRSRVAHEQEPVLAARLAELDAEVRRIQGEATVTATGLAERREAARLTADRIEAGQAELAELLEGSGAGTVRDLIAIHDDAAAVLTSAQDVLNEAERCRHDHDAALADVLAGVREAGFASGREALLAHLPEARLHAVSEELDQRKTARASAQAILDEPGSSAALLEPESDLHALQETADAADTARGVARTAHELTAARLRRVSTLMEELATARDAWRPIRDRHRVTAALAALVEGKSADNAWKMRLSAYVLGERLRQVVAAANERLAAMTDQRFLLEQSDERGAGEQRGGLSLRMRDQWSGKQRDPATLSGGETFLVSLALALGLADTVTHEAGGTQLDTLFIDEGFGALDATTLDGVMDTLDALRDGGRVVGLVSHVPELRNRVSTQLEVLKSQRGSTVRPVFVPA